ncbi:hypothetical protein BGZ51_002636 [Haplosporangium sp. Z 767]|nr:hypothetical protein BGZ51_002636 [Haplosporangium sp. Z 767]
MPRTKKTKLSRPSKPTNTKTTGVSTPYGRKSESKATPANYNKATQAKNKHRNSNLTSELDSLLGDLNSQLQRKTTKKDSRTKTNDPNALSESEKKLNEEQAKHESLQQDMRNALDGISSLGK